MTNPTVAFRNFANATEIITFGEVISVSTLRKRVKVLVYYENIIAGSQQYNR
jgi:hypothetical protein